MNEIHQPNAKESSMFKNAVVIVIGFILFSDFSNAQVVYTDSAANYTTGTWTNGSNLGVPTGGFQAWNIYPNTNTATWGTFVGSAATSHGTDSAGLDTAGSSFGIWANTGSYANAERDFTQALQNGDSFKASFSIAWDNGNRGFNLFNSGTEIFSFNVGSRFDPGLNQSVNVTTWTGGGSASLPWTNARENGMIIDLLVSRTTSGFDYSVVSSQGGLNASGSITASGVTGFKFYVGDGGGGSGSDFLFNKLELNVIPEPSTPLLMGLGLVGLFALRKTRKA